MITRRWLTARSNRPSGLLALLLLRCASDWLCERCVWRGAVALCGDFGFEQGSVLRSNAECLCDVPWCCAASRMPCLRLLCPCECPETTTTYDRDFCRTRPFLGRKSRCTISLYIFCLIVQSPPAGGRDRSVGAGQEKNQSRRGKRVRTALSRAW